MNLYKAHQLILIFVLGLIFSCSSFIICSSATAVLRQHHERSGILRYHAQSSLKDKQGMTWQVVLFPEYQSNLIATYHLRLVGFPGIAEFIHPQPLEIITARGEVLDAPDIFNLSASASNVGEFDLTHILPVLPAKGSLKLSAILKGDRDLSLKIPESVLVEWQWLAREI